MADPGTRSATAAGWLGSFAVLIAFQLAGTGLVGLTGLPLPGPVIGLTLLAVALVAGRRGRAFRRRTVTPAADSLLDVLPLLFVPAGVGVVEFLPLLGTHLAAVTFALLASFTLTLLGTGGLVQLLLRRTP